MPSNNYSHVVDLQNGSSVNGHTAVVTAHTSPYELRSDEVQDIMTKMPSLIIRQGTSVLFAIIILLFIGAYFIRFPDIVATPVHIKPVNSMASATLSFEEAKKIRPGQRVLIKLDLYSFEQFGLLEGQVEGLSPAGDLKAYAMKVRLVNGLVTTTGKRIDGTGSLSGIAEVLTSDKTILQRLFESL